VRDIALICTQLVGCGRDVVEENPMRSRGARPSSVGVDIPEDIPTLRIDESHSNLVGRGR
jgi:hypothetical protein